MPRKKHVFIPQRKPCQQCDGWCDEDADVADDYRMMWPQRWEEEGQLLKPKGVQKGQEIESNLCMFTHTEHF